MVEGRSFCACTRRPTFPPRIKNPLTPFRPTLTAHSPVTAFRVNTYVKHRGGYSLRQPIPLSGAPFANVFPAHPPAFFCKYRTGFRPSPFFSASSALRTEKHPGEGSLPQLWLTTTASRLGPAGSSQAPGDASSALILFALHLSRFSPNRNRQLRSPLATRHFSPARCTLLFHDRRTP
jgi:hypothetical protein